MRLYKYYSLKHLSEHKTAIHNALLKYGYSNFTLDILEYCEDVDLILREQFYLDLLKPEYNILQQAGSSLGFKHSDETLEFFKKDRKLSEEARNNLSLAATGRILTEKDKIKISDSRKGIKLSDETRANMKAARIFLVGVPVTVKNLTTLEVKEYTNITEAAAAIGVSRTAVNKALKTGRPVHKIYYCTAGHKK